MVNGFGVAHGGVTFAFADSAFAFASNSHGRLSLAVEAGISFSAKVNVGDTLTATSEEVSLAHKLATYNIRVENQDGQLVGMFRGTVYRTRHEHLQDVNEDSH